MTCAFCIRSSGPASPRFWDVRSALIERSLSAEPDAQIICTCPDLAPTLAKERLGTGRARCTMNMSSGLSCRVCRARALRKCWRLFSLLDVIRTLSTALFTWTFLFTGTLLFIFSHLNCVFIFIWHCRTYYTPGTALLYFTYTILAYTSLFIFRHFR